jgi:hypothetical protein
VRAPGRTRRWLQAAAALALVSAPAAAAARVLVVGVDGAGWPLLDPLLAAGELPALAALVARGATAELDTVEPVVSPVVWTSIASGRSPNAHGVTSFLATRLQLRVPTAFERLAAAGLRVGLYEWLVTWPPRALPGGFVIPGWLRRDPSVWPEDVWRRAGAAPFTVDYSGVYSREAHVAGIRDELARRAPTWLALARAFDVEVGGVTYYAVDRTCHRFWREAYPDGAAAGAAPRPGSLLRAVLGDLDRALGALGASLGPDDVMLVVSDHGFRAADEARSVWVGRLREHLARADLSEARDAFTVQGQFSAIVVRVHPGRFELREPVLERFTALLESARGPEGEPLFDVQVLDGAPRPPGHERPLFERVWQQGFRLAARLRLGVRFDLPAHATIVARPEADTLERLWPKGQVSFGGASLPLDALMFREVFDGTHDPTALLLAVGGPIAPRAERARLSVLDVAPLVHWLADQPIPDDLEGELPRALLSPEALAARPPRAQPAALAPALPPEAAAPGESASDAELRERLRVLGYVE